MKISIELLVSFDAHNDPSILRLLRNLINLGWTIHHQGSITYVPLNNDQDSDWITTKMSIEQFIQIATEKEACNELIGVKMRFKDTPLEGKILLQTQQRRKRLNQFFNVTLCVEDKISMISGYDTKIPDVNWYLIQVLPCFNNNDGYVEFLTFIVDID